MMSIHDFNQILERIKSYTDFIYLHLKGEPLLHPEIGQLLDICFEKGFLVNIVTNGTLIKKVHPALLLKPAVRQINFSLHCLDELNESVNKDEYLEDIFSFVQDALKKTKMYISLRLWNRDKNQKSDPIENNKKILSFIENKMKLDYFITNDILVNNSLKISDRLYLNFDYEFQWPDMKDSYHNAHGYCYGLKDQAAIHYDGTVVPCCLDSEGHIRLGNILDQPFTEIINSERAKKLQAGFSNLKAVEELCIKCRYKERFA